MGYRSEVSYIIRFETLEDREAFINVQLVKKHQHITEALKELTKLEDTKLFFHAEDVKWYDSYPDVKSHHDLMNEAVEMFDDAGFMFYRIGEEMEDIDVQSEGDYDELWDYLSVHRSIDVNIDTSKLTPILTEEGELA